MNFTSPITAIDALRRDVAYTFGEMRKRLEAVETTLAALAPLRDSDRMEVARVSQAVGVTLKDIDRRDASDTRAQKANAVFSALRQKGWSIDRIAKATDYSTRGVAANLKKFGQSALQETGHDEGQQPSIAQNSENAPTADANLNEKQ